MIETLKKLNVLYIEDNTQTRLNYEKSFKLIFNSVYSVSNYDDAMDIYNLKLINLLIVDIELEDKKNGYDIAKKIKNENADIPIIFLTGHNESEFILEAINSDINGYLVKPLDLSKLTNVLDRLFNKNKKIVSFNNLTYDINTLELLDENENKIILGRKENKLLQTFIKNKNRTLSRDELEFQVWDEPLSSDSTLKNLIASLRKKIGKEVIVNESKLGWRIKID